MEIRSVRWKMGAAIITINGKKGIMIFFLHFTKPIDVITKKNWTGLQRESKTNLVKTLSPS